MDQVKANVEFIYEKEMSEAGPILKVEAYLNQKAYDSQLKL